MSAQVPTLSQIKRGVAVNVVLKPDQRTGKLTPGHIADILTSHNHPRGVKVRLLDGQVGRVQSLSSVIPVEVDSEAAGIGQQPRAIERDVGRNFRREDGRGRSVVGRMQEDYRNEEVPAEERALEDYVVVKAARKPRKKGKNGPKIEVIEGEAGGQRETAKIVPGSDTQSVLKSSGTDDAQMILEKDFPQVDTALIAAMLAERQNLAEARDVLKAISG